MGGAESEEFPGVSWAPAPGRIACNASATRTTLLFLKKQIDQNPAAAAAAADAAADDNDECEVQSAATQ